MMLGNRLDAQLGGLMSYFADLSEHWMQVADYVDRILNGAVPGDLPVMLPTKFQLVLNLKTARALGTHIAAFVPGARRRGH
jgi:putative ABC transport system substrate-binding protein